MSDAFTLAHKFTARWEGGFVNNSADPGGATNYGVSLRWLEGNGIDINGDGRIDIADIKALTPEKAAALFRSYFWDYLHLGNLPPLVAIITYDAAVNTGCAQGVKFLQRACNRFAGQWLAVDGGLGPQTAGRVTSLYGKESLYLCEHAITEREEFHRQLGSREPFRNAKGQLIDYRKFLSGWLHRTSSLWGYVQQLFKEGAV